MMKTILVVDDDLSFLASFAEMVSLLDHAYDVKVAENGKEALAIIKSVPVDLLITDLRMPVMAGFELVHWMMENRPDTPVIVMSADVGDGQGDWIERAGHAFFDKPLDMTGLSNKIRLLLPAGREA